MLLFRLQNSSNLYYFVKIILMDKTCNFRELWLNTELFFCDNPKAYGKILYAFCGGNQCDASLRFRRHAHGPLAKRLMHMVHFSGNTSGGSKSSLDWLNYTGFPGDVCVVFFNVLPGKQRCRGAKIPRERRKPLCLQM